MQSIDETKYLIYFSSRRKGIEPAYTKFNDMSPSVRKSYTGLYFDAKSEDAKKRRLEKIIGRLNMNLKPM